MCYMQHKNSTTYVLKSMTLLTITCWALDDHLGDCTIYFFQQVTSLSRQGPNFSAWGQTSKQYET